MAKKAKCEASTWSDFKRNVLAGSKSRDMSAIYGSSIPLEQHNRPFRRSKRVPSQDPGDRQGYEPAASKPLCFTKVLLSTGVHTNGCCRIILPPEFCEKHNVERNVTMTDSSGRRLWHMRFQSCASSRRRNYAISKGWREFSYDHNLKVNDRLVYTLMSTSHFVVEFATSKGSTRAMLPRRNRKDYPWRINYSRLDCLSIPELQGVMKKRVRKNVHDDEDDRDDEEYANNGPPSTPRGFTKILSLKCGIATAKICRLTLPLHFCEKHNVEKIVTMTDSAGHRLWHMRFQSCGLVVSSTRPRVYCISNGWREFSYDHSLKVNDTLVFTLLSTSQFLVEFATSNGSTREMLPTKDGTAYPWQINYARLDCLSVAGDQSGKTRKVQKNVASIAIRHKQKAQKESMFCQCNTAEVGKGMNTRNDTRKAYVLPELTHLECKNADGSSYLQIVDSDSDSEMMSVDGED